MNTAVAASIAHATRTEALADARADLDGLRERAIQAGREESRRIVKVTKINSETGLARYRPAGRLLRDWYLHCYLNTLRGSLGAPHVVVDAQQVEDTTALLRRLNPHAEPLQALRAVGGLKLVAEADAAQASVTIMTTLRDRGPRRAVRHALDDRFDGDELQVHITRHWYLRSYNDHIEAATASRQPLTAVTHAEEHHVGLALAAHTAIRLVGDDATVLVTVHGTRTNDLDRTLAGGEPAAMPATLVRAFTQAEDPNLRRAVLHSWSRATQLDRSRWAQEAGLGNAPVPGWNLLPEEHKDALTRLWLQSHSGGAQNVPFDGEPIHAEPAEAARLMFGHPAQLHHPPATAVAGAQTDPPGTDRGLDAYRPAANEHRSATRSI